MKRQPVEIPVVKPNGGGGGSFMYWSISMFCVTCVVKKLVSLQIVITILPKARKTFENFVTIIEAFLKTLISM